ncbi:hypothetical protein MNBD_PLANCTO03-1554 [hydrothermal vent metagenome]|uniref:Membrane transporter protein n=1 Tax=hydrothermal vent metagenome TaxID=652676 RepID=A0A3B1DVV0_9ZZZZ
MTPLELLIAAGIGLVAGLVGGLCGIGGSIIMLPALAMVFGYPEGKENTEHHLYIAAAMLVNAVVAATAIRPHIRAGAIDRTIIVRLLPPMAIAIIGGVVLGDQVEGRIPKLVLVGFLYAFVAWTLFTAIRKLPEPTEDQQRATGPRLGSIGLGTGLIAGFLGIGGGIVMVPAMQLVAKVPLRRAIAASAVAMCVASPIGAVMKFSTLSTHGLRWQEGLTLGLAMAVGASVGSPLGARLTHKLKLPHLRLVVALVLGVSGLRLAGIV